MAKRMTVQEVLDEIVAHQDSGDLDFDDESGDCFIANSSALTHIYPVHAHRGSETESEGCNEKPKESKTAFLLIFEGSFYTPQKTLKLGVK